MLERLQNHPNKVIIAIFYIFILHYISTLLFQTGILPTLTLEIGDLAFPPFQTTQILFVFPLVLIITYFVFIRKGIIKWQNLGFNKGRDGLGFTISLGILGGLIIGAFNYFTINHFVLQDNILPLFFEKCIFAPIWEEFLYRVLLLTILEFTFLFLVDIYVLNNPKYKEQFTEPKRKWLIREIYLAIILVNAIMFVFGHGEFRNIWISISGIIMAIVYLKTRSIIAPVIVHSMHNFVTGGFLFLVIRYLQGIF